MNAKIEALREALKDKVSDTFEVGDVIRWLSGGKYTYAALKTPVGWYTTARLFHGQADGNGWVNQVYTYEGLLEMLARAEVTNVQVSTGWETL